MAPRAGMCVYARVLVLPNLYMHAYIHTPAQERGVGCGASHVGHPGLRAGVGVVRRELLLILIQLLL